MNLDASSSTNVPAHIAMQQMISGFWVSQAIYTAAKLGIADCLQEQPKTVEELATITNTHAPSLYRVLRALASMGIFEEDENSHFNLTPLAGTLLTDAPNSLRSLAIVELEPACYKSWGNLQHSVKTGEVAFDYTIGTSIWNYYAQNPSDSKYFNQAMTNVSNMEERVILSSYDFSPFSTVVDVGGGQGSLLASILKTNPTLKGILFDLPQVIEDTLAPLQADVTDRCTTVGGNFFESVPDGGDAYLLKRIIHDWEDEKALAILKNCYQAMPKHAKLLLFEMVITPGNKPFFGKLLDLTMLAIMGGRERTEVEYRALLEAGGFQLNRIIPTPSLDSIIEAIKA